MNKNWILYGRIAPVLLASIVTILGCSPKAEYDFHPRLDVLEKKLLERATKAQLSGIFVDAASKARNSDGKTWATAFRTIQEAIEASNGERIIIAAGIYKSPKIRIKDRKNLKFVGGYKAGETEEKAITKIGSEDWAILDGDGKARTLLEIMGNSSDITFLGGIVFRNVTGASAVKIEGSSLKPIKNINFFNCRFEDNRFADGQGGGIKIEHAQAVFLTNVYAQRNQAQAGGFIYAKKSQELNCAGGEWLDNKGLSGGPAAKGGSFYGENLKLLTLKPAVIRRAEAELGAGIYLKNVIKSRIADVRLEQNSSPDDRPQSSGAGLYIEDSKDIDLNNVTMMSNRAKPSAGSTGGALAIVRSENISLNFVGNEIFDNKAHSGGALSIIGSKNIKLKGGNFQENEANHVGGAIFSDRSDAISIEESTFFRNKSLTYGGALFFMNTKQGILLNTIQLRNNEVSGEHGGALAVLSQHDFFPIVINNALFFENKAPLNGGAAFFKDILGAVIFRRTVFENNRAEVFGGALALDAQSAQTHYAIERDTKFINNHAGANAGGGALCAVFRNSKPPKHQLLIENQHADYQRNTAGDNRLGTLFRVTHHSIDAHPPQVLAERGEFPLIFGSAPLLDIHDFINDKAGFDFSESQTSYLW